MTDEEFTYIFLTGQRKAFHHEVPDDWECVAYERFDYVECGVYRKKTADLNAADLSSWVAYYADPGDEFVTPHDWKWPTTKTEAASTDRHADAAKLLFDRCAWEFMNSMRKGNRDDSWFELGEAIRKKWPSVDPDTPTSKE